MKRGSKKACEAVEKPKESPKKGRMFTFGVMTSPGNITEIKTVEVGGDAFTPAPKRRGRKPKAGCDKQALYGWISSVIDAFGYNGWRVCGRTDSVKNANRFSRHVCTGSTPLSILEIDNGDYDVVFGLFYDGIRMDGYFGERTILPNGKVDDMLVAAKILSDYEVLMRNSVARVTACPANTASVDLSSEKQPPCCPYRRMLRDGKGITLKQVKKRMSSLSVEGFVNLKNRMEWRNDCVIYAPGKWSLVDVIMEAVRGGGRCVVVEDLKPGMDTDISKMSVIIAPSGETEKRVVRFSGEMDDDIKKLVGFDGLAEKVCGVEYGVIALAAAEARYI